MTSRRLAKRRDKFIGVGKFDSSRSGQPGPGRRFPACRAPSPDAANAVGPVRSPTLKRDRVVRCRPSRKYYIKTPSRQTPQMEQVRWRLQLRFDFDCDSTALPPFDDLRYDRRPTCVRAAALRPT